MPTVATRWIDFTFLLNGVKLNVTGRENLGRNGRRCSSSITATTSTPSSSPGSSSKKFTGVAKKEMANDPVTIGLGRLADVAFIDRADSTAPRSRPSRAVQDAAEEGAVDPHRPGGQPPRHHR